MEFEAKKPMYRSLSSGCNRFEDVVLFNVAGFGQKYTCLSSLQSKIQRGKKTRSSRSPSSISYFVKVPLTHILHHCQEQARCLFHKQ